MSIKFNIKKESIKSGLEKSKNDMKARSHTAILRAIQVSRAHIVPKTPVVTSRLINSISGNGSSKDTIYKIQQGGGITIKGRFGTNVEYARRVEFGFVGRDSLGREYNQKGQFFFTRGLKEAENDIKKAILNALRIKA